MPTVLVRGEVVDTLEVFELKGFTRRPIASVFVEESILGRETQIPIAGLGPGTEPPPPVLSAHIIGMPVQATELTTLTALEAELRDEDGNVIDPYTPAEWTWSIDSGGGSFGGPNNDDLTLPAAPATVVVRATHTDGLSTTEDVSVVAQATLTPELFNLPGSVIEGQTYDVRARLLNSDDTIAVNYTPSDWTFSVASGPASITGANGDVLSVNANSAGGSVTVRATYEGSEAVNPAFDDSSASIVAQPQPGDFPDNEPADMTPILFMDGSSKDPGAAFTQSTGWQDNNRIAVVSDPLSKYGNAIEKRFFEGDSSGWHGLFFGSIGLWRELYMRYVFMMSSNWQYHGGTNGKIIYYNKSANSRENILLNEMWAWSDSVSTFPDGSDEWLKSGRQIPVPPGSITGNPQAGTTISRGEYHTVEIHHVASLTPKTGTLRMWTDGIERTTFKRLGGGEGDSTHLLTERTDASTLELSDKRIGRVIELPWFWGGSGLTKDRDDYVRFSEIYISGKS